jgi:GNAT-like C-terminal domain/N-acyltransferase N-terminal domain
MTAATVINLRHRLSDPALPSRITSLGFRGQDVPDLLAAAAAVAERDDDLDWMAQAADRIVSHIGDFLPWAAESELSGPQAQSGALGTGVLPMLTLLATAPEVAAFHASRGIPAEVSTATLADLGQQVWVHRLTYGEFGLHTQGWLTRAWCGALYWLGRLQFELRLLEEGSGGGQEKGPKWVLSTHIPRTGPLSPSSVDDALEAATGFFARYFPDYPTRDFFCESWMLDPQLPALLPDSNLAAFQRRWSLFGDRQPGDAEVLFFVFNLREPVDPESLPRETALQRAVASTLAAGQHWSVAQGRLPQRR